jgi:alpha-N-arabinofuranosidase
MYFMANYAQTVNVIGAIKTSKTDAALAATGVALALYRKHFGEVPVATEAGQPLDVAAALSEDGRVLTVAIVNATMEPFEVPLSVEGGKLAGSGRRYQMAGPDPMAYNEPGRPPKVTIEESSLGDVGEKLKVAPCSASIYALDLR